MPELLCIKTMIFRKGEDKMSVIQVSVLGIAGVLFCLLLKKEKPEYAVYMSMTLIILIFFRTLGLLGDVIGDVRKIYEKMDIKAIYLVTILRMIGITYVGEFASNICKDAGYSSVAGQIEIYGKLAILSLSMPIVLSLIETIGEFL